MALGRKPPKSKLWLICFGVKHYTDTNLEDLTPAVNNCRDLAEVFKSLYPTINNRESIIICDNDNNDRLPTKANLEKILAQLKTNVNSLDIILFYLYGHGKKTEKATYYCCRETDPENLEKTAYSLNTLVAELGQLTSEQTIVFLDTCYSGNIKINYYNMLQESEEVSEVQGINNKGFYLLTSSSKNEQSFRYRNHSLFAYFLIKALGGDINSREISGFQLLKDIKTDIKSTVENFEKELKVIQDLKKLWECKNIPYAPKQQPGIFRSGFNEDFIITKSPFVLQEHFPRKAFIFCDDFSHPSIKKFEENLKNYGCFEVEFIKSLEDLAEKLPPKSTILLYLRGKINEEYIKNGDRQISLQALRDLITPKNFEEKQLILCLDSVQRVRLDILKSWVDSLRLNSAWGDCIIAKPQGLLKNINAILKSNQNGLSAAELITQLQKNNSIAFPWLSGEHSIIEIIPQKKQQDQYKTERDWQIIAGEKLNEQKPLTSNILTKLRSNAVKDMHVRLELWEKKERKKPQDIESSAHGSQFYDLGEKTYQQEDFFEQVLKKPEIWNKHKGIAIIGEAGAGKTSYLQQIALWILDYKLGIPIWISLKTLKCNESEYPSTILEKYITTEWISQKLFPNRSEKEIQEITKDFWTLFQTGRVWLLLDGADEIATRDERLFFIHESLKQNLAQAKVILTCRQNLWDSPSNALNEFQCYRTRPFSDEQIKLFIDKYFSSDPERGQKISTELFSPDNESIKDTLRIPLFLTMLSFILQSSESEFNLNSLTKSQIFEKFIESIYNWKKHLFSLNAQTKNDLEKGIQNLALEALESDDFVFRLPESAIKRHLGDSQANDSLFLLACQLGLLNYIG